MDNNEGTVEMLIGDYVKACFSSLTTSPAVNQFVIDNEAGKFPADKSEHYQTAAEIFDQGYMSGREEVIEFIKELNIKVAVKTEE